MRTTFQSTLPSVGALSASGQILRVVAGVLLLTASAKVQVPFWPVPMTLQVAAVMAKPPGLACVWGWRPC